MCAAGDDDAAAIAQEAGGGGGVVTEEATERGVAEMEGATMPAPPAAAAHHDSRPAIGFPLGTALLVVVIFCLSGVFACCYHWEKLRSLSGRSSRRRQQEEPPLDALEEGRTQPSPPSPTSKLVPEPQENKEEKVQSLPVIMPGDKVPKFMAWPCPCQRSSAPVIADVSAVAVVTPEAAIPSQSLAECSVN